MGSAKSVIIGDQSEAVNVTATIGPQQSHKLFRNRLRGLHLGAFNTKIRQEHRNACGSGNGVVRMGVTWKGLTQYIETERSLDMDSWSPATVLRSKFRGENLANLNIVSQCNRSNANPWPFGNLQGTLCDIGGTFRLCSQPIGCLGLVGSLPDEVIGFGDRFGQLAHLRLGFVGLLASGGGKFVRINSAPAHFPKLTSQDEVCPTCDKSQYKSEKSHPFCSGCGDPRRLVGGCFLFFSGYVLLSFAFYISDAPYGAHSWGSGSLYFSIGLAAFACVCQGVNLIFELL